MSVIDRVQLTRPVYGSAIEQAHWRPTPDLLRLTDLSARLPRRDGDAIEVLLAAARPFDDGFLPLRPLWAQEATHRAFSTLRLFDALGRRDRGRRSLRSIDERRLALHLARELASLETVDLHHILPCSTPLRDVARDLVALFGPATGQVLLDTDVTQFSLPAYRCRAIVLLATELVTNALTHAFPKRSLGHISMRLWHVGAGHARLLVRDDGVGFNEGRPNPAASVVGALSDLLQGELRYGQPTGGGAAAELTFPFAGREASPFAKNHNAYCPRRAE